VIEAVKAAREQGLYTAGLLGGDGGGLRTEVELSLVVESRVTARVQETHIFAGHLLCQMVDDMLFQPR
ncbi:MAG: phosphoheptose isomerase, partial [Desulfobacteraceae bacterium]